MKLEYRALKGLHLREAPKDSGYIGVLAGYAAMFNRDSVRFAGWEKDWVERIAPGAFRASLETNPDVVALWSHDSSRPAARTPDTLTVREDDQGLAVEISLVDTATNRDLLTNVRAKIVDSMSFGFMPVRTRWEETPELDVRTLLEVEIYEVSPVVWPAYPDTSIGERSHRGFRELRAQDPQLKEIMQEREKFLRGQTAPAPQPPAAEDTRETRLRMLCKR